MGEKIGVSGCLVEKKGRYYAMVYYSIEGHRVSETKATGITVSSHKKKEAKKFLDTLIQNKQIEIDNLIKSEFDKVLKHSFADEMEKWLIEKKDSNQIDQNTASGYLNKCKTMINYFRENCPYIEDIEANDFLEYYKWALAKGRIKKTKEGKTSLSRRTVREHASLAKQFLDEQVVKKVILKNPAKDVKVPTVAETRLKKENFMFFDQTKAFLEYLKEKSEFEMIYNIAFICSYYGFRRSEILGLRWSAIDFDNDEIEVSHTSVRIDNKIVNRDDVKKEESYRYMPLLEDIKALLLDIKQKQIELDIYYEDQYVIVKDDGTQYNPDRISKLFKKAVEKCPVKGVPKTLRLHGLRHTAVAVLFEQGWELGEVQQWVGHKDISTTANIYNHASKKWKNMHGKAIRSYLD